MSDASNADGGRPERPWASPKQEPTKGVVQPRIIPPFGKPTRHTNILDYILHTTLKEAGRHKHVWPFLKPVDAVTLGIPHYHDKIPRAMDLKTIESRIKNTYYTTASECVEDIETVFQNCYTFNGPEDDVTIMAQNVHAVVKKSLESAPNEEKEQEISWGKKKKGGKERMGAGSEKRERKEGSMARMTSEAPSECGSEASSVMAGGNVAAAAGEKSSTNPSKMAVKTMKSGAKRKADSDDEEKPEPVRAHKREASSTTKKAQLVPVTGRLKFCQKLLTDFYSKKYFDISWPFHSPVNATELGLHDYHKIIKEPMDMSTIKKKLEHGEYTEPSEFAKDFKLMLDNCMLYNPVGDPIHNLGKQFMEIFEKRWKDLPTEKGPSTSSNSTASHQSTTIPITPSITPTSATKHTKTSLAPTAIVKQEVGSATPPNLTPEGSKSRTEDGMRLENALAMIREREDSLKTNLRQVEELKSKVMRYRNSSRGEKIPESLYTQVRTVCQTTSNSTPISGAKNPCEPVFRATNGREIKKEEPIGYDFDSDAEDSRVDMSYDDKRQLSLLINRLAPEHLATIVQIIERREHNLANRNQEDSEIEIDFEALGPTCLREMNAFARYILKLPPPGKPSTTNYSSSSSSAPISTPITTSSANSNSTLNSNSNSNSNSLPPILPPQQVTPSLPQISPQIPAASSSSANIPPSISSLKPPAAAPILEENTAKLMRSPEEILAAKNAKKEKKKSQFNISESSDSDPSRKRRKVNKNGHKKAGKDEGSESGSSSSSSDDDDSEDDYKEMQLNRKGGMPPYHPVSATPGSSSTASTPNPAPQQHQVHHTNHHNLPPRLGGMGGQPPMARVPPPLPNKSSSGAGGGGNSQHLMKKKSSTAASSSISTQPSASANASKTILDDLLPDSSSSGGAQKKNKVDENDEERIERLRREAKLARQREDENSMGMSNQMEMMTAFEFDNMY
ncbi:unnamed protein product [Caenorhabditis angaria]|uniref:Bromodomain-containing protein n=1 Tax=Caenorhabditis angaria TaxID=860376 RepID=A0A9P1I6U8_9PELO|nr:unnamed protein product [Caenorhabditis angaria]